MSEGIADDRAAVHGSINYELCTSLDMTKFGMVLDRMVAEAGLHPVVARTYRIQAASLLASVRSANNLAFGKGPASPIL